MPIYCLPGSHILVINSERGFHFLSKRHAFKVHCPTARVLVV